MPTNTMTAALGIIKMINPQTNQLITIGKMKNVRVTETFRRIDVKGIGALYPVERPVVDWSGSFSAQTVVVDLHNAGFSGTPNRDTNDPVKFANTLMLNEQGLQVFLYRKAANQINPATGIVETILEEPVAVINDAFIDRWAFDLVEGQVMAKDQDFTYLTPILAG